MVWLSGPFRTLGDELKDKLIMIPEKCDPFLDISIMKENTLECTENSHVTSLGPFGESILCGPMFDQRGVFIDWSDSWSFVSEKGATVGELSRQLESGCNCQH
ncbi:hypothetical protein AVEN_3470-1 [Araneus ventricosus]|uniref:Uncharacterized protein n=1 Tax=Araneus ventricosus TaxID=182803 RepID=A0A4Y2RBG5_ARAVE|nr:hypothetical protein AVEN_3470-1 [Araneus ventricosus]